MNTEPKTPEELLSIILEQEGLKTWEAHTDSFNRRIARELAITYHNQFISSDQEIEEASLKRANELFPEPEKHFRTSNHHDGFMEGAKWMRDKLKTP